MRRLFAPILLVLLVALGWFAFAQPLSVADLVQRARDAFDRRPARHILMLGNSRTYYHDMPAMLRAMADSAGSPTKYEIALLAPPGASFEILWNDPALPGLLAQTWDDAILQGESRGQSSDEFEASFLTYGAKLAGAIRLRSGAPRLVVNWDYDASLYDGGDPDGSGRAAHFAAIESVTGALAERSGARRIDVGQLWGRFHADHPGIALTEDGNHPTVAGSYLFALMLFADLSHADVGRVTYLPAGLDAATAATIRGAVQDARPPA